MIQHIFRVLKDQLVTFIWSLILGHQLHYHFLQKLGSVGPSIQIYEDCIALFLLLVEVCFALSGVNGRSELFILHIIGEGCQWFHICQNQNISQFFRTKVGIHKQMDDSLQILGKERCKSKRKLALQIAESLQNGQNIEFKFLLQTLVMKI